jgi:hypothetical protein
MVPATPTSWPITLRPRAGGGGDDIWGSSEIIEKIGSAPSGSRDEYSRAAALALDAEITRSPAAIRFEFTFLREARLITTITADSSRD